MKTCKDCTHYHDFGEKLMCSLGMMEVILIGGPKVIVDMPDCTLFDEKELEIVSERKAVEIQKVDKRTKAYKEANR